MCESAALGPYSSVSGHKIGQEFIQNGQGKTQKATTTTTTTADETPTFVLKWQG